mgnify:CR=1 FL=1
MGGAAAAVGGSSGGLLGAATADGSVVGPACVPFAFHKTTATMAAAATPASPYQTARLPRDTCVVPHAEPVLAPDASVLGLDDDNSDDEMPLELKTREMRSALRGPTSGENGARSAASAVTLA